MRLNEEEYNKYMEIHPRLIYYAGVRKGLIPKNISHEKFMNYTVEEKYPIRNALYKNIRLVDDFIKEKSSELSEEDKEIIQGFKHFRRGEFYVIKMTKKYAFFLGDEFVYGVHALNDPFEMFWGNRDLPIMVEAVLLPFKGKIIYDGIVSSYPVRFGRGLRSSLKNEYSLAEAKYGVITNLPEGIDVENIKNDFEKELLAMMKTKSSREHNWYQIEDLLEEHPELNAVYIREWGRINSRKKKKELKGLGIKKRWFAIYNDTIILSGTSEKELKKEIGQMISSKENEAGIFYFKI